MTDSLVHLLSWVVPLVLVLGLGLLLATRFFVNVGAKEIAIKERRFLGKKMPPGRVVAVAGEVGIQADVLKPGLHFLMWPLDRVANRVPLVEIGPDEIGVIEAIDGQPLPDGRIYAPDQAANKHNNFQDPIAFLNNGGVKGIQMRTLPTGKWPIHPYLFRVSVAEQTVIQQGMVGVVTAADGAALDAGRLLGKAVAGHGYFQDAETFISKGGQKGPQIEVLKPGTYRILVTSQPFGTGRERNEQKKPGLFTVTLQKATVVPEDQIGIVEALDGKPLGTRDYVATPVAGHDSFQDGATFIANGGQRGVQQDILSPGVYYINPSLFKVIQDGAQMVQPGEAAVIVCNFGQDPTDAVRKQMSEEMERQLQVLKAAHAGESEDSADPTATDTADASSKKPHVADDAADQRLDSGTRESYVVPDGYRGIQNVVVGPGRYNINTKAKTAVIIPTTNQTVEWTQGDDKTSRFDPFEVVSKDGFKMQIEVRVVFRVRPGDAPWMVAKIGTLENLIGKVMHPTIDSIFRNQASESSAMAYLQNRHTEQLKAEQSVRNHLIAYHVDVVNVLICHIHLPEDLMKTQTDRILAEQNQTTYDAQEAAQKRRIELQSTTARADQQQNLMAATVGVQIAEQKAEQRKKEAAGEAYYITQTGTAQADVTRLQGQAQGVAYKEQVGALGQGGVALVQVIQALAAKGLRITPDIVAGGGTDGGGLGGVIMAMLAQQLNGSRAALLPATAVDELPPTPPAAPAAPPQQ